MELLDQLLTLIFPRHCFGCDTTGSYLCPSCRDKLEPATDPDTPSTHAIFSYREPLIRALIKKLKYKQTKDVANTIAEILYDYFLEEISEVNQFFPSPVSTYPPDKQGCHVYTDVLTRILVIPVPMHPLRLKDRGYNQAAEIARHFVRHNRQHFAFCPSLLIKTRPTQSQVQVKNRAKRLANLKGVFAVNPVSRFNLDNQIVILIDDVITTGATMEEAIRVLREAGAKRVIGLALAHG